VRAMGTRLRVTAQLIETRRGYHLWSQQYDFDMEDVFEVQEAIARAIAGALGDELLANLPTKLVAMGTRNTQAYDLYLRGRHEWNRRTTDGMWNALHAFEQAVALDPRFANAYAGMSDAWQLLPDYGNVPAREGLARAKTAALRAIALDTTLAEAYASLGAILDDYDRDRRRRARVPPRHRTQPSLCDGEAVARDSPRRRAAIRRGIGRDRAGAAVGADFTHHQHRSWRHSLFRA
jgi:hypothetical protein